MRKVSWDHSECFRDEKILKIIRTKGIKIRVIIEERCLKNKFKMKLII